MKSTICVGAVLALSVAACGGRVVEQRIPSVEELPYFDGAFMSYFLPRGEMTITAAFDPAKGSLVLANEGVKIVPDLSRRYFTVYRHNELSHDNIAIEIDTNGLLKYVGSTTEDQTAAVIRSVGAIFKEVGALRDAAGFVSPQVAKDDADCKAITVRAKVHLDDGASTKGNVLASGSCKLILSAHVRQVEKLPASAFPDAAQPEACPGTAVCFRMSGGYVITVSASLLRASRESGCGQHPEDICVNGEELSVVAPVRNALGQLHFNRRAFVKNTTKATFTNGMLTKIEADDPSAIVGFLQIPVELLKATTILVEL